MTPLVGFAIITPSFHFDPPSILLSSPVKFMGNAGSINHVSFTINVLTLKGLVQLFVLMNLHFLLKWKFDEKSVKFHV